MDSTRMPVNKNGGHRFIKRRKVAGFTLLLHNHENHRKARPRPVLAAGGFMALCHCGTAPWTDFCTPPYHRCKGRTMAVIQSDLVFVGGGMDGVVTACESARAGLSANLVHRHPPHNYVGL